MRVLSVFCFLLLLLPAVSASAADDGPEQYNYFQQSSYPPRLLKDVEGYHLESARKAVQRHNWTEAENNIDFILGRFPNHPEALRLAAEYGATAEKAHWAIQRLQKAIRLYPKTPSGYVAYGYLEHRRGNLSAAVEHYRAALERSPNNPEVHYNLGLALFSSGQPEAANRHAQVAYDRGFPLPGLRQKLREKGAWNPGATSN